MFAQKNLALGQSAAAAVAANYIEDVFSTYLHSGSGTTTSLNVGVDLSTYGGLVWSKTRSGANSHGLIDTARGVNQQISTNLTAAQNATYTDRLTAFTTTGFTLGADASGGEWNQTGYTYVKWAFRKQAKFFDVVTYTGNGANRTIAHNLGSVPGTIIIKRTDTTAAWAVYHRSLANTEYLVLNTTAAKATGATYWNSTTPTSTEFSLGTATDVNANAGTYVAYLFAHDAGGFGAAGTDNVISCGSYVGNGSTTGPVVTLGYEPQWVLVKRTTDGIEDWEIYDNMRGIVPAGADQILYPNQSSSEQSATRIQISATGFSPDGTAGSVNASGKTYIYIAIRRGPMRTPTSGTSVFSPVVYTGTNVDNRLVDMSLLTDMAFVRQRNDTVLGGMVVGDRLRGDPYLLTGTTDAEVSDANSFMTPTAGYGNSWSAMNGFGVGNDATSKLNASTTSNNQIAEGFRRAPGFFDVVCYTGTGANRTVSHNLGVAPELMIVKSRSGIDNWIVYSAASGNTKYQALDSTISASTWSGAWNNTSPTSSVFTVGNGDAVNQNADTFVSYLFATVAGVSKVGSYTGTGTTLQIDCGFTAGARFVMIKRTNSTGDWYVWDSARGIVAGNDPYLLLNSTAAEVTNTDYVDAYSAGFELSSTAPAAINANGGTFIFLAIA